MAIGYCLPCKVVRFKCIRMYQALSLIPVCIKCWVTNYLIITDRTYYYSNDWEPYVSFPSVKILNRTDLWILWGLVFCFFYENTLIECLKDTKALLGQFSEDFSMIRENVLRTLGIILNLSYWKRRQQYTYSVELLCINFSHSRHGAFFIQYECSKLYGHH